MGGGSIMGTRGSIAATDIGNKIIKYKEFKNSKKEIVSVEVLFEGIEVGASWHLVGHYSANGEEPDRTPTPCTTNDRWHKPGDIQEYQDITIESREDGMFVRMEGELAKSASQTYKHNKKRLNQSFIENAVDQIEYVGEYRQPFLKRVVGYIFGN